MAVPYEHRNKPSVFIKYSRTPLIRTLVIRIASYPDRFGLSGKYVENSTKLTCLEITGYRIQYNTGLWLLKRHITRDRKVETQVHTVNNNCQCSLFFKKIQLSEFSTYPDGSPPQLFRVRGVLLYKKILCLLTRNQLLHGVSYGVI
jgi:hypothetical protein